MAHFLDLLTPETWQAFREIGATTTGFRERHRRLAEERVSQGDIFLLLPDSLVALVRSAASRIGGVSRQYLDSPGSGSFPGSIQGQANRHAGARVGHTDLWREGVEFADHHEAAPEANPYLDRVLPSVSQQA